MKHIYLSEEDEKTEFAIEAAVHFSINPEHSTYTKEDIDSNAWFAMRYGLDNDCVVVFKISDAVEPTNFMEIIKTHGDK